MTRDHINGGAIGLIIGFIFVILLIALVGAKPHSAIPGVCIYEISVSTILNTVNIGWTAAPCKDIDVRTLEGHNALEHSGFNPACPVYSIEVWPNTYLPIVDYERECVSNFNFDRRAIINHAIAKTAG